MARVILVTGDKGGVGKSFFSRSLMDYLSCTNGPQLKGLQAFDTDPTNATFFRFYSESVKCLNVDSSSDLDRFLNQIAGSNETFLIDCAARTLDALMKWIKEVDLFSLKEELGIQITLAFLLGPEKDCVQILSDVVSEFKDQVEYLIVKNQSRGKSFEQYENSNLRTRIFENYPVKEISMPALLEKTALTLDQANLTFTVALESPTIQIADKQRVKIYRKQMAQLFQENSGLWS